MDTVIPVSFNLPKTYGTEFTIEYSTKESFPGGNTVSSKVDELFPGFSGDLAGGKWMRSNTAVFPSPLANEYHFRNYPVNTGDLVFDIAKAITPTAGSGTSANLGLSISQGHYMCKAMPISIQVSSLSDDFSKPIRKRLITSKEANFARDLYLPGGISANTALNDQALCNDDGNGNYICNPYVNTFDAIMVDWNNSTLATNYGVSYPFTASLSDPVIPDQGIYLDEDGVPTSFSYSSSQVGVGAKWAVFSATKDDAPYSDMTWINPASDAPSIRCAVQIELDYIGGGLSKVDGR